jgi:hypothetical protein
LIAYEAWDAVMSDYRIEKIRQQVRIAFAGGEVLEGEVFLQPNARYRSGPQEPAELFNSADAFVPFVSVDGSVVLVAKDHIITVQFDGEPAGIGADKEPWTDIEVAFSDGSLFDGQLRAELGIRFPRLLDFLNEDDQRFLTLRFASCTCLVNRRQVARVRQR